MEKVKKAKLISNIGIDEDIHASNQGKKKNRQILLMDIETLNSFNLETGIIKENITTQGLKINDLKSNQKIQLKTQSYQKQTTISIRKQMDGQKMTSIDIRKEIEKLNLSYVAFGRVADGVILGSQDRAK